MNTILFKDWKNSSLILFHYEEVLLRKKRADKIFVLHIRSKKVSDEKSLYKKDKKIPPIKTVRSSKINPVACFFENNKLYSLVSKRL